MPEVNNNNISYIHHTDDIHDIITEVPSWIVRWGTTIFFIVLIAIMGLSAAIQYPDIIKAQLTIDSPNSPKPVVSKITGKLVKLLITENENVKIDQPLAYLESTADHFKIITLIKNLKKIQTEVSQDKPLNTSFLSQITDQRYGELQTAFQTFFQEYTSYVSSVNNGFLIRKKEFLLKDLSYLSKQQLQLNLQKAVDQKDFSLASEEYDMHNRLEKNNVETKAELRQEESKFLTKKTVLVQAESAIITGSNNHAAKQREILELDNQITEEKGKFLQALNTLISIAEDWKSKYILTASQNGKVSFAGIIQQNQVLSLNEEVFDVNPGNEQFFGEMAIPQNSIGKIREGQGVLIKLRSYPFEEYGIIRGTISSISAVPYRDSIFMSKVSFISKNLSDLKKPVHLKQGMVADVDIISENATILHRIFRNITKAVGNK